MRFYFTILLVFALCSACLAVVSEEDSFPPALDSVALSKIDTAMDYSGTTRFDTEFEKKWAGDSLFQLEVVERILDHPLELPDSIDSWTTFVLDNKLNFDEILRWEFKRIDEGYSSSKARKMADKIEKIAKKDTSASQIPEPYGTATRYILASMDIAEGYREKMLEDISSESLDSLLYLIPGFWTDSEDTLFDSLECYFHNLLGHECDTSLEIHLDSLYITMHNFHIEQLGLAAHAIITGLEMAREVIERDSMAFLEISKTFQTRHGKVIIGSSHDDLFNSADIIIDAGGNDLYRGRYASGVIGHNHFGVVLDIEGDDIYDSKGEIFTQASGIFGVGMLMDLEGDDYYAATHYGQGAGLFGVGMLFDLSGDDLYAGGVYVQGCGNFGVGGLIDMQGEDGYRAYAYAQAFSGPKGFGFLGDYEGSDQYFCGGKYSHAPLAPFDYHSFAQGFSIGWRPDVSGGIGFLFDKNGNDTYSAGVYSQGVSYWYSLALLVDNYGNDVYTSVWYPQGSGIHLSIGSLVDRSGNDIYVSPQGPGQGSAHDYSVGFFSEYRGNDIYVIDGGNGTSLTNSFALFVDRNGDDMYAKRKIGSGNWALARGARGTGSMGIFIDIQGEDHYSDPAIAGNNSYWFQRDIGFGMDIDGEAFPDPVKELSEEIAEEEEEDSIRTIEDIFNDASVWGVGSAIDKADNAFQELLDSAETAAEYICEKQLDTKSSLKTRTIKRFCEKKPDLMRDCLFDALQDENRRRKGKAIYLLGEMKDTLAVDKLIPLLKEKRSRISVISALGKIEDTRAVPHILKWTDEKRQAARYTVAKALSDIADPQAIDALIEFLKDDYITVRVAAQNGLVKMKYDSIDHMLSAILDSKPPQIYHLLRAISLVCRKIESDEDIDDSEKEYYLAKSREKIIPLLQSSNSIVRGHSARAISIIGGEKTIDKIKTLYETETDPFTRDMYLKAIESNPAE